MWYLSYITLHCTRGITFLAHPVLLLNRRWEAISEKVKIEIIWQSRNCSGWIVVTCAWHIGSAIFFVDPKPEESDVLLRAAYSRCVLTKTLCTAMINRCKPSAIESNRRAPPVQTVLVDPSLLLIHDTDIVDIRRRRRTA